MSYLKEKEKLQIGTNRKQECEFYYRLRNGKRPLPSPKIPGQSEYVHELVQNSKSNSLGVCVCTGVHTVHTHPHVLPNSPYKANYLFCIPSLPF